jgi:signal transduction histidine kinase
VQAQFAAVLAERSRIAREIHDTLAQGFVAVSVHLELVARAFTISADAGRKALKQVQTMVQDSLAEARRSIWELRSHTSDDDLASKLSALASRVSSTTQTKAEFQVFGTRRPLPPKIERELLKIGQEAISNVIRHSAATNVRLELSYEPTKVRLVVSDDGRGFANEANAFGPDGHFGLKGMRERAEHIDAELRVKSAPGEGTEILVETEIH